jgi:hypothetical protein
VLHIADDAIRDDQQDVVFLVLLAAIHVSCHLINEVQNWCKVCWSIQFHTLNGMLINFDHVFDSVHFGVEDVAIECEAVIGCLGIRWDGCSEPKHWDLLVTVVILQNAADSLNGLKVLVLLKITDVVQRAGF